MDKAKFEPMSGSISPTIIWQIRDRRWWRKAAETHLELETLPDYATMQSIEYHPNGKVARIVFRPAPELVYLARELESHLQERTK